MDILIFDQEYGNNPVNYIQPLLDNLKGLNANIFDDLEKAKKTVIECNYDFAIIDFSTVDGKSLLDYLLEKKPTQKIITIAYELSSSESNCEECAIKYNKRRLIKPIDAVDVFRTIKDFDNKQCQYFNHFNNPCTLVEDLMGRYDYFAYDKDTQVIQKHIFDNDLILREYIDIIDTLNQNNIKHEIIDEYKVKILEN